MAKEVDQFRSVPWVGACCLPGNVNHDIDALMDKPFVGRFGRRSRRSRRIVEHRPARHPLRTGPGRVAANQDAVLDPEPQHRCRTTELICPGTHTRPRLRRDIGGIDHHWQRYGQSRCDATVHLVEHRRVIGDPHSRPEQLRTDGVAGYDASGIDPAPLNPGAGKARLTRRRRAHQQDEANRDPNRTSLKRVRLPWTVNLANHTHIFGQVDRQTPEITIEQPYLARNSARVERRDDRKRAAPLAA